MNAQSWKECRKVLCVRPDNLGDVLMTTPALHALREALPGRSITLLTSSAGAALAPHLPDVDEYLRFDAPWYKHESGESAQQLMRIAELLRERAFDSAVIFTVFSQSPLPTAMLCHMAGIPRVAAYCRENPYALIPDWVPDTEPFDGIEHEVERQLRLARLLGAPQPDDTRLRVKVFDRDRERVDDKLRALDIQAGEQWVVMHPGASEEKRRYPPARFAAVARLLWQRHRLRTLITGSAAEARLAARVADEAGPAARSLAGQLSLGELIALIERASLLVSNNTGPVHLAAAAGTRVVVLYALTNPQHTPWQVPHRVLPFDVPPELESRNVLVRLGARRAFRVPAGMPSPDVVVEAVIDLLEERPGGSMPMRESEPVARPSAGCGGVAQ